MEMFELSQPSPMRECLHNTTKLRLSIYLGFPGELTPYPLGTYAVHSELLDGYQPVPPKPVSALLPSVTVRIADNAALTVSGQPMALDLKFQGIRASISVTGQP